MHHCFLLGRLARLILAFAYEVQFVSVVLSEAAPFECWLVTTMSKGHQYWLVSKLQAEATIK